MVEATEKVVHCPSAPAEPGAMLIGIVGKDGRVAHLATGLKIGPEFIKGALVYGPLEKRFRFSSPCQEKKCTNWNGSACGVVEALRGYVSSNEVPQDAKLSPCAIREGCRWWIQRGKEACLACPLVITDQGLATGTSSTQA